MITVVICTYNRRSYLKKAMDSIINQAFNPKLYELIIVDNNSTDGTKEFVLNNYSYSRVKVRYLNEPNQGLSHCRNTGLRNAKFEYIAYIDDDGIAYSDWLENMAKGIKGQNEKFAGITGAIFPIWEIPRPRWLLHNFDTMYSIYSHRDKRTVIRQGVKVDVFGGNMVWKRSLLIEFGGFNKNLGREKNKLISGEESLTAERMIDKGYEFIYDPKMRIKHHIHKSRINIMWLIKRSFWGGYTRIAVENIKTKQSLLTKFRQSFKEIIRALYNIWSVPKSIILEPRYHFLIKMHKATESLGKFYGLLKIK